MSEAAQRASIAWRRHNRWLCTFALATIAAAVAAYQASRGLDGRDAFYVALSIEFAVWGAINFAFGVHGTRDLKLLHHSASDDAILVKARGIVRLLLFNRRLNALWVSMGLALLAWGYSAWSASLCGHGVAVLFQALALTVADERFLGRLRAIPDE